MKYVLERTALKAGEAVSLLMDGTHYKQPIAVRDFVVDRDRGSYFIKYEDSHWSDSGTYFALLIDGRSIRVHIDTSMTVGHARLVSLTWTPWTDIRPKESEEIAVAIREACSATGRYPRVDALGYVSTYDVVASSLPAYYRNYVNQWSPKSDP